MSKARKSTQETMTFTLEQIEEEEAAAGKKRRKERVKKTITRVIGRPSMMVDDEEEEEEELVAPLASLKSSWKMPLRQVLLPPSPSPKLQLLHLSLLHPRDQLGTSQLLKRTRPQCQKFKRMKSHKCSES
jgi:hypothetical protein